MSRKKRKDYVDTLVSYAHGGTDVAVGLQARDSLQLRMACLFAYILGS